METSRRRSRTPADEPSSSADLTVWVSAMAANENPPQASQQGQRTGAQAAQRQPAEGARSGAQQSQQRQSASQAQARPAPAQRPEQSQSAVAERQDDGAVSVSQPGAVFDPHRAIRVGILRLARDWADEGHVYSAINTYRMVLRRYPGTGAAAAAVEDLLDLARYLQRNGMYFTALNIFNTLEELV